MGVRSTTIVEKTRTLFLAVAALGFLLFTGTGVSEAAAPPPIKEVLTSRYGWEVNRTTKANVCDVEAKEPCQGAKENTKAGGYSFPKGVATAPNGDVYVTDTNNSRVQELTASGVFVRMFGWNVDRTQVEKREAQEAAHEPVTVTQAQENVCTAASGDVCQQGVEGGLGGQMNHAASIAVDQATGNVFIQDASNVRVDEYTAAGEFVLAVGTEVDKKTKADVCTAESGDECGPGVENTSESNAPAAFAFTPNSGTLLAVGGPNHLLYVGDEHRIQEFDPATGEWKGEISLTSISSEAGVRVVALSLDDDESDPEYGDLFVVYGVEDQRNVVRKFAANGSEVKGGGFPLVIAPLQERAEMRIEGLASDSLDRLAVIGHERPLGGFARLFGFIYDGHTGHFETEFAQGNSESLGLAFGNGSELFAVILSSQEIIKYKPFPVAELLVGEPKCTQTTEFESNDIFECLLEAELDPWGVDATKIRLEYGRGPPPFEGVTPEREIVVKGPEGTEEPPVSVSTPVTGLRPNQSFNYRLAAFDKNVEEPEPPLTSEIKSFTTPLVAPKVIESLSANFVGSNSAVLAGELNPENASTEYYFEYAPTSLATACTDGVRSGEACPSVSTTPVASSSAYGKITAILEARNLRPESSYRYRLAAEDRNADGTQKLVTLGQESEFTTAPAAKVEAATGGSSSVTATSALIVGSINPDGQGATYAFELGIYKGADTQYGVVFSGPVAAETAFVEKSLLLTGLQPGTEYAYRIKIESGYGRAIGATGTFLTEGLPAVLPRQPALAFLPPPTIGFPKPVVPCKKGYTRDSHGRCVKQTKKKRKTPKKHKARKGSKSTSHHSKLKK